MPSKRQPSKQRRAARNRARSQALAARRDAASQPRTTTSVSSGGASSTAARRPGLLSGLLGGGGGAAGARRPAVTPSSVASDRPPRMFLGVDRNNPGATALLVALPLGLIAFVFVMMSRFPVDDRGEPLPRTGFHAVYLEARGILTGERVTSQNESIFDVVGPGAALYGLIPLGIVVAAYVAYRRSPNSRPLTFGMLGLAVVVLFTMPLGFAFILPLGALAAGSFQARRAELPARMAEREAARGQARKDDDEEEDEYLDDDEELAEEEYSDEEYDEDTYLDEDEELADEDDDEELEEEVLAEDVDVDADVGAEDEETATPGAEDEKPARGRRRR